MPPLSFNISFQFLTFAAIGSLGTAVHYTILIMLASGVELAPVLATSIGALFGALTNYLLNYRYTFRSSQKHTVALSKFIAVALVGFGINAFIVEIGVTYARWHYLIAQVLATIAVLFWGFAANKIWTFKGENNARQ